MMPGTDPSQFASNNSTTPQRSEIELLLLCCWSAPSAQDRSRIEGLLQEEIDWSYLMKVATNHAVIPLLYSGLSSFPGRLFPAGELENLKKRFEQNALRNLAMTAELRGILSSLESKAIPAIPYKGPVLAEMVYGSISLRQFLDLDILVRKSDVSAVSEILRSRGYAPQFELSLEQQSAYLEAECELLFQRERDGIIVEVHWDVSPRYFSVPFETKALWSQSETVSLSGSSVRTIPISQLLPILAAHGGKHNWERLSWVCDIDRIVASSTDIDWEDILAHSRALGIERIVLVAFALARELLGTSLPAEIQLRLEKE